MKKAQVKVGGVYAAKVSGKVVQVRIDAENPRGGYDATNLATKKKVRIKSAQRLRGPTRAAAGAKGDARAAETGPHATRVNVGREEVSPAKTKAAKKAKTPREKKPGCLDAAVRVLKEAGKPMRCQDIVEVALQKNYWRTAGRTPHSTLYSAVLREVQKKGKHSRFHRAEVKETKDGKAVALRGYFDLTDAARKEA